LVATLLLHFAQVAAMYASVYGLDLAIGIKEMLIKNGFASVDTLLETPPAELAIMLGIDLYIARLIYHAAKRHTKLERFVTDINEEEMVETLKISSKEQRATTLNYCATMTLSPPPHRAKNPWRAR
jgi:hypothetical protein